MVAIILRSLMPSKGKSVKMFSLKGFIEFHYLKHSLFIRNNLKKNFKELYSFKKIEKTEFASRFLSNESKDNSAFSIPCFDSRESPIIPEKKQFQTKKSDFFTFCHPPLVSNFDENTSNCNFPLEIFKEFFYF